MPYKRTFEYIHVDYSILLKTKPWDTYGRFSIFHHQCNIWRSTSVGLIHEPLLANDLTSMFSFLVLSVNPWSATNASPVWITVQALKSWRCLSKQVCSQYPYLRLILWKVREWRQHYHSDHVLNLQQYLLIGFEVRMNSWIRFHWSCAEKVSIEVIGHSIQLLTRVDGKVSSHLAKILKSVWMTDFSWMGMGAQVRL
jgi:hypothetical protein